MPKDMKLPFLSIIFFDMYCPMRKNMPIGIIQLSRMLSSGDICLIICPSNFAPASCRRTTSPGSLSGPVL